MFLSRSRMPLLEVALLAEGVDRNRKKAFANDIEMEVALLAEGVDRNTTILQAHCQVHRSPSSRRAWIEISTAGSSGDYSTVALLAEGVDRNFVVLLYLKSLP